MSLQDAFVAGVGFHPFGRFPDKTLKEISGHAALAALSDAALDPDGIDAVFCSNAYAGLLNGQESVRGETWMRTLGIGGIPIINVENACAGGGTAVYLATMAVRSGQFRRVLVVGAEKMYSGDTARAIAALATSSDIEFTQGIGMQFAAVDAIRVKKVMSEENIGEDALNWIASKSHANGALNPIAQFQKPMTPEEVGTSRMIADPVRLYMCSAISDGAAACVIAADGGTRKVRIAGSALASSPVRARQGKRSTAMRAAEACYAQAAVGPDAIDFAEVHDAVAPIELIYYRDLGFCPPGGVARFVAEERPALRGSMPFNPSGGINSRGHPVGATGVAQICELTLQISGDAGDRQLDRARRGIALNAGGWMGEDPAVNAIHILEAV
ncbi:MAG: Acetyl-CoA acetyltransferase [Rhodobacteraceae bacterium HLUCCA12]|nr:MAG: Acetyl-CoA acetyltransferase [Rhodobacteraceae bacterium HLUCCA12]